MCASRPGDFLLKPWLTQFRGVACISSTTEVTAGSNDHEYLVHPDHCLFCQKAKQTGSSSSPSPSSSFPPSFPPSFPDPWSPYTLFVHFGQTTIVTGEGCPQRAYERTPISFVVVYFCCLEAHTTSQPMVRVYSPHNFATPISIAPTDTKTQQQQQYSVLPMSELFHAMEHAVTIVAFDDMVFYAMLRHTPEVFSSMDQLHTNVDWRAAYPVHKDPFVPQPYKPFYEAWLSHGDKWTPELKAQDVAKLVAEQNVPKQVGVAPPLVSTVASLNPAGDWPASPSLDIKGPDWEDITVTPDYLWNWKYDPAVHVLPTKKNTNKIEPASVLLPSKKAVNAEPKIELSSSSAAAVAVPTATPSETEKKPAFKSALGLLKQKPRPNYFAQQQGNSIDRSKLDPKADEDLEKQSPPLPLFPPAKTVTKACGPYASEASMKNWRPKTLSIGHFITKKDHSHCALRDIVRCNQSQKMWSDRLAHIARAYPSTAAFELSQIVGDRQQIAWWQQKNYSSVLKTLLHELNCMVDLSWCVLVNKLKLKYPKGGGGIDTLSLPDRSVAKHFVK